MKILINPCKNPCATIIDIPKEAESCNSGECPWKEDIQFFFCPPKWAQDFWFDNEDRASISCYDYSEEHGGTDNLTVGVQTKEQNDFLLNKAYK